jgi:hypothetical protein
MPGLLQASQGCAWAAARAGRRGPGARGSWHMHQSPASLTHQPPAHALAATRTRSPRRPSGDAPPTSPAPVSPNLKCFPPLCFFLRPRVRSGSLGVQPAVLSTSPPPTPPPLRPKQTPPSLRAQRAPASRPPSPLSASAPSSSRSLAAPRPSRTRRPPGPTASRSLC